ncbi:MAG TPA: ATP-binding protein [Noviherbaspirillum sp.]
MTSAGIGMERTSQKSFHTPSSANHHGEGGKPDNAAADRLARRFALAAPALSALAICVSTLAMLGWFLDVEVLKAVVPGLTPMKFNAALAGFVIGLGILHTTLPSGVSDAGIRIARTCAAVAFVVGVLTTGEYLFAIDLGIDELFVRELNPVRGAQPGRMAATAAVNVVICSMIVFLLTIDAKRFALIIHAAALLVVVIAVSMVLSYAYAIEAMYRENLTYTPMAANAAVLFVLLAMAVFNAHPDYPFRRIMSDAGVAGATARRLVPVAVFLPLLGGTFTAIVQETGYTGHTFATSVFATTMLAGFSAIILWTAGRIYRAERLRERAEEEVRAASLYTRSLIEASLDPLVTIDAEGRITDVNKATEEVTGHDRKHLIGTSFADYFVEREEARAGYLKVFKEEKVRDYPLTITRPDGGTDDVLYNATVYRDSAGAVQGVFAAARVVTELKRTEQELQRYRAHLEEEVSARTAQLEAAYHELEMFSYSVSHDLRIPLRAMDGFSRILLEEYASRLDDEGRRMLGIVRSNSQRMARLIDDILDFIRLGKLPMKVSAVDVTRLVQAALDNLSKSMDGREIKVNLGILPAADGDRAMLLQVFINLIGNAIKFTRLRSPAVIEVSGCVEKGERIYCVRDNGVGFDMRYAGKLFGVFHRLHGVDDFEGNGTGLAIVKRIVLRHGGRVWAEGQVGKGATFYFSLPSDPDAIRAAGAAGFLASPTGAGMEMQPRGETSHE